MKKFKYLVLTIISFMLFMGEALALDYFVSVTSKSVTVGNSVTLKIDGASNKLTGRFNVSTSDSSVASLSSTSVWIDKDVGSITINAKKAGTAIITISPKNPISDADAKDYDLGTKKITITVTAKQAPASTATRTKSSNSYLASLSVEGLKLEEAFDKELLEYKVIVPAETEKIKINAQLADSNARVSGVGEQKVSVGLNTFSIVVTAENGTKRTYTLTADVQDLTPINVKVEGEEYSVVRKKKDLPEISEYYTETTVTIGEEVVDGYENKKLGYTLVGLKDKNGVIEYYIYNNGKYTLYKEYNFGGLVLQITDEELEGGYKKTTFTYDNEKITGYQEVKRDLIKNTYALDNNEITGNQFYLFYAKNVETGRTSLYQYDALEKTVQRYNTQVLDIYKNSSDTYYMALLVAVVVMGVILIIFSLLLMRKVKDADMSPRRKKLEKLLDEEL